VGFDRADGARRGWDASLTAAGGDLLQSWGWGEFKRAHGWSVERVRVAGPGGEALAQILFRQKGPFSIGYLPRGPVNAYDDEIANRLLREIDAAAARHRAAMLLIEPAGPVPATWLSESGAFVPGPASFQTSRTVVVDIHDDDTLLAQMRKDTRANIGHAQRRGITVEQAEPSEANLDVFYDLLRQSSEWNRFGIHTRDYYADFLHVFGSSAVLIFVRNGDVVTGGLVAARVGERARSLYAGSAPAQRGRGDAALLRLAAMQWARDHGCTRFDLGGIAPAPPTGERTETSLKGVDQFKTGFGGAIVSYPETLERRYRPLIAWAIRRAHARFRTGSDQGLDDVPGSD